MDIVPPLLTPVIRVSYDSRGAHYVFLSILLKRVRSQLTEEDIVRPRVRPSIVFLLSIPSDPASGYAVPEMDTIFIKK